MNGLKVIWLRWKWGQAREKMREKILERLQTRMDSSEVRDYNINVIIDSSGWLGGDYTEEDIKYRIWSQNRNLFKRKKFEDLARF